MNKNILSIDTSLTHCSIAILINKNIDSKIKICHRNHEKHILPMLQHILKRNKIKIYHFNIISFSNGPGNFTGIRVAASIVQGLSIPYNIPIIGISTLHVLAEQTWRIKKIKNVIICMQSGKKHFYWAQYIKNDLNVWIGKKTEVLLNIKQLYQKIHSLKTHWYIIGSGSIQAVKIKNTFLTFINITTPHAQDLIPLTIDELSIKKNKYFSLQKIKLNYLNNPFYDE